MRFHFDAFNMSEAKHPLDEAAARALVYVVSAIMLMVMTLLIGLFLASYLDDPGSQASADIEALPVDQLESERPSSWWSHRWGVADDHS